MMQAKKRTDIERQVRERDEHKQGQKAGNSRLTGRETSHNRAKTADREKKQKQREKKRLPRRDGQKKKKTESGRKTN